MSKRFISILMLIVISSCLIITSVAASLACAHNNLKYVQVMVAEEVHEVWCKDCGELITTEAHSDFDYSPGDTETKHNKFCGYCGQDLGEESHEAPTTWTTTSSLHKKVCGDCNFVFISQEHTLSSWMTTTTHHYKKCSVCKVELSKAKHIFGSNFSITQDTHTAVCTGCSIRITQPHNLNAQGICTICGGSGTASLPDTEVTE